MHGRSLRKWRAKVAEVFDGLFPISPVSAPDAEDATEIRDRVQDRPGPLPLLERLLFRGKVVEFSKLLGYESTITVH